MLGMSLLGRKKNKSPYIGFHDRMFAATFDIFIATIFIFPVARIIIGIFYDPNEPAQMINIAAQSVKSFSEFVHVFQTDPKINEYFFENHGIFKLVAEQILQLTLFITFLFVFWIKKQATPGKMIFGTKIVDAKTLEKPSTKQFILRFIGYIISFIFLFLGFIWIAFDKKKQGWHDKLAGTVVVKK